MRPTRDLSEKFGGANANRSGNVINADSDFITALDELKEAKTLSIFRTEFARTLSGTGRMETILQKVCELLVRHWSVAFARIWILDKDHQQLCLKASAGCYTHLDGPHSLIRVGEFKIGRIARTKKPHVSNDVVNDPEISNHDWAREQKMVAFAGFPLMCEEEVLGVIGMFSRNPFSAQTFADMPPLADILAQCVQQKRQEQLLKESEERFRLIARATNDVIWDWNLRTDEHSWTEGVEAKFGYSPAQVKPTIDAWSDLVHPEDRPDILSSIHDAISRGAKEWQGEYRFLCGDGTYAIIADRGHIITDNNGVPVRMIGGMLDITEQKKAEVKLREQSTALDNARDAIIIRNLDHEILYWNKSAERFYGWTSQQVMGKPIYNYLYSDRTKLDKIAAEVLNKGEWSGEIEQLTSTKGRTIWVDSRWTLIRNDQGAPKAFVTISTDNTEKRKLEAQFLRAQRMESIGALAGGIAHDLNNVLAPIIMGVELLKAETQTQSGMDLLTVMESSAKRGAELIKQVLSFAKGTESNYICVNPLYLVKEIKKVILETFPKNIQTKVSSKEGLIPVHGDPTQLHQVLMNLCVNARDAMPDGGTLSISLDNVDLDATYAGYSNCEPGNYLRIQVTDTGTGMPPEIQARIFDPFFTTKAPGKGTGLGLSTTIAIVKSHKGIINVYSEQGIGTRFCIYLPTRHSESQNKITPIEQSLPRGTNELIMVVDDEEHIRKVVKQTLETSGYRVLLATDGVDAVANYAQHGSSISAVITDMAMPLMDGNALILALKAMDKNVRVIASSGHSNEARVNDVIRNGAKAFISKPYTSQVILNKLREILPVPSEKTEPFHPQI